MSDPRLLNIEYRTRPSEAQMKAKERGELKEGSFVLRVTPGMLRWLFTESDVRGCRISDILGDCVVGWMNRIAGMIKAGKAFEKPTERHEKGKGVRVRLLLGIEVLMRVRRLGFEDRDEVESFFLFCLEKEMEEERIVSSIRGRREEEDEDEDEELGVLDWVTR